MSQLNALLSVLRNNNGDELILEAGAAPQFFDRGKPLKLFLRAIPEDRHASMLQELIDEEQLQRLARDGALALDHEVEGHGSYAIQVRGPEGTRIRVIRAGVPAEEPEPIAVAPSPEPAEAPRTAALPQGLNALLGLAAERRASDLHLASGEPPTLRVDGSLSALDGGEDADALLRGLLTEADLAALESGRSIDRAIQLPSGGRFRMNLYRHTEGLAAAFRVLRPAPPPLARLRMPVDLRWVAELPHGLVLFCGPTGSGKSTTMAALVQELLTERGGLLITLEDPIEYTFAAPPGSLVRQREIGRHVRDFPTGLRDALREDPEVLLVGEMRDPESIQLALTAAETGHLVLASLHSRTAPSAVERIVDAYPPERQRQIRVQLADALRGVVSQRLLPRASGSGRTPAVEVLRVNHAAANLIREGKTAQLMSVIQTGGAEGMIPMDRCIRALVEAGRVRDEDA